jgi:hypothetical protein
MAKQKQEQIQTQEPAEKLNRKECADQVVKAWLASNNGDTTLDELAARADQLFRAGHPNAEADEDTAAWGVQTILEQLESLDLVELEWHCGVSPKGRLNGNGNGRKSNGNGHGK